jgi:hypothetical protein
MVSAVDYQVILDQARKVLESGTDPAKAFGALTDVLTRGRAGLIKRMLVERGGTRVRLGPLAGMHFHAQVSEGCYVPKLLGCYEAELHPVLVSLKDHGYTQVIDIGCAEGYYAVGLALLLPDVLVFAHDIDPVARDMVAKLAELNGVSKRVRVGGRLDHDSLQQGIAGKTLVFCDCEGGEYDLLTTAAVPALVGADLIVELHGVQSQPQRARQWLEAMSQTHEVNVIPQGARNPAIIPDIAGWKHLDQLLALWEFRGEPTPWAWMRAKG